MDIVTDGVCCKEGVAIRNLIVSFGDDGNENGYDSRWLYYTMNDERNTCVFRRWRRFRPPMIPVALKRLRPLHPPQRSVGRTGGLLGSSWRWKPGPRSPVHGEIRWGMWDTLVCRILAVWPWNQAVFLRAVSPRMCSSGWVLLVACTLSSVGTARRNAPGMSCRLLPGRTGNASQGQQVSCCHSWFQDSSRCYRLMNLVGSCCNQRLLRLQASSVTVENITSLELWWLGEQAHKVGHDTVLKANKWMCCVASSKLALYYNCGELFNHSHSCDLLSSLACFHRLTRPRLCAQFYWLRLTLRWARQTECLGN